MPLVLNEDQTKAKDAIVKFLSSRDESVMVLSGYAGTGKTTLIRAVLDHLPKVNKLAKIVNPKHKPRDVQLTATTHKAVEAFATATNREVVTVHSHLGIRVRTNFSTGENFLSRKFGAENVEDQIILIDEASYIDEKLMRMILTSVRNCKVIFIGDPTQLTPVKSSVTPVFESGYPTVALTQVVRQDEGNPIKEVCDGLRQFIRGETAKFPKMRPDGKHIIRLSREEFDRAVLNEFTDPEWSSKRSKMLAWRNKTVDRYNAALRKKATGRPMLSAGDYAVNNHYITRDRGKQVIKTDETVLVTSTTPGEMYGIEGIFVDTSNCSGLFMPVNFRDRARALEEAIAAGDPKRVQIITETWCDLRAAYCCTVNKSQGSTYDKAYIDIDDICACDDANQLARMLYVAISRARHSVILVGG